MQIKSAFSPKLKQKIELLNSRRTPITLGSVGFSSPLLLAPMSMICKAPFRRLMEELGAGGTISELISCHGINYQNKKTLHMLKIHPNEKHIGIQLFGEDESSMAKAAKVACEQEIKPKFIDINMGCPVRKVVSKGGGSALLKDPKKLGTFFRSIKSAIDVPLSIKIRTGWDDSNRNADEIINIAFNEGIEFVAVHGRTRTQQYKGLADWDYLEEIASRSPLPIIGNGDLNTAFQIQERKKQTQCKALMMGRSPLRNPFIFLESEIKEEERESLYFSPLDYLEVIEMLLAYILEDYQERDLEEKTIRHCLVQLRKHIIWYVAGFKNATQLKNEIFKTQNIEETLKLTQDFFHHHTEMRSLDADEVFMTSGHG